MCEGWINGDGRRLDLGWQTRNLYIILLTNVIHINSIKMKKVNLKITFCFEYMLKKKRLDWMIYVQRELKI